MVFAAETKPRLAFPECERAVGRLMAGDRVDIISLAFNVHPSTLYRFQERFMRMPRTFLETT